MPLDEKSLEIKEVAPASSPGDILDKERALAKDGKPTAFRLRTPLLEKGRIDTPLAATPNGMTVRIKSYAEGGENELHEHRWEDHMFVILQGRAVFHGPDGERLELGVNEGIMLPAGTVYSYEAAGDENLVLLRVGHQSPEIEGSGRFLQDGTPITDQLQAELQGPTIFRDGKFFG